MSDEFAQLFLPDFNLVSPQTQEHNKVAPDRQSENSMHTSNSGRSPADSWLIPSNENQQQQQAQQTESDDYRYNLDESVFNQPQSGLPRLTSHYSNLIPVEAQERQQYQYQQQYQMMNMDPQQYNMMANFIAQQQLFQQQQQQILLNQNGSSQQRARLQGQQIPGGGSDVELSSRIGSPFGMVDPQAAFQQHQQQLFQQPQFPGFNFNNYHTGLTPNSLPFSPPPLSTPYAPGSDYLYPTKAGSDAKSDSPNVSLLKDEQRDKDDSPTSDQEQAQLVLPQSHPQSQQKPEQQSEIALSQVETGQTKQNNVSAAAAMYYNSGKLFSNSNSPANSATSGNVPTRTYMTPMAQMQKTLVESGISPYGGSILGSKPLSTDASISSEYRETSLNQSNSNTPGNTTATRSKREPIPRSKEVYGLLKMSSSNTSFYKELLSLRKVDPHNDRIVAASHNSLNIVDEKTAILLDSSEQKVNVGFEGLLEGKFYINQKYLNPNQEGEFPIACYRRNFNSLSINLNLSSIPEVYHPGEDDTNKTESILKIEEIVLSMESTSNFSKDLVEVLIFDSNGNSSISTVANSRHPSSEGPSISKEKDGSAVYMLTNTISLKPFKGSKVVVLKRFQFKKATPNNGKSVAKDYYYINLHCDARLSDGSIRRLATLRSIAISVRGRNPSFYNDRNEILISKDFTKLKLEQQQQHKQFQQLQKQNQRQHQQLPMKKQVYGLIPGNTHEVKNPLRDNQPRYTYFPIKSNYYVPPVHVYYFPHNTAHKEKGNDKRFKKSSKRVGYGPTYKYFLKHGDESDSASRRALELSL